jgi:hypothetical protein
MTRDEMKKVEERESRRRLVMPKGRSKFFPLIYAWFFITFEALPCASVK